jgi:hypothetical protein
MKTYTAVFSSEYKLRVEDDELGTLTVRIHGPKPIHEHREAFVDLQDAKDAAYWLACWHFKQRNIDEKPTPFDQIQWEVSSKF